MTTTVNILKAKAHLSRLVDGAAKGQEFVATKADSPIGRIVLVTGIPAKRNLGFNVGQGCVNAEPARA